MSPLRVPKNNKGLVDPMVGCPWSKHRGVPWEIVVQKDRAYVEWLISQEGPEMGTELYDHLTELLENEYGFEEPYFPGSDR